MNWITTPDGCYAQSCIGKITLIVTDCYCRLKIGSRQVAILWQPTREAAENWLKEAAHELLQPLDWNGDNTAGTMLGTIKLIRQAGYVKIYLNRKCIATTDQKCHADMEIQRVASQLLKEIDS